MKNLSIFHQFIYFLTINYMAGVAGLEPTTGGFEDRCSTIELHPY